MKKYLAKASLVILSVILMLLIVTACGESESPVETTETPSVEKPATPNPEQTEPTEPEPEPLPEPEPVIDNGLRVDVSDMFVNCPSSSLTYDGDLTNCNLDDLVMFSAKGDTSNPEKFGVMFYASKDNNYQNQQVAKVLNAINNKFFYDGESVTMEILSKSLDSIYSGFTTEHLSVGNYDIQINTSAAQDGGIIYYFITKP